jgi:hypothetical protein
MGAWFGMAYGIGYAATDPAGTTEQRLLEVMQQTPVLILMGVGYVVIALASGVVLRLYLMRDLWQRVAASTRIHNLAAADNVAARGDTVSALGEGFADSLDVTGF